MNKPRIEKIYLTPINGREMVMFKAFIEFRGNTWVGVGMTEDQAVRHAMSAAIELPSLI